jgi:hypothetical protein
MLKRIPVRQIRRELSTASINQSCSYLTANRHLLEPFPSLSNYIEATLDGPSDELKGIEHHLLALRAAVARRVWSRGVFIGVSVLDSLVYSAVTDIAVTDPAEEVLKTIQSLGMHRPGFVVYPLHSLGIVDVGVISFFAGVKARLVVPEAGVAVSPQTNDVGDSNEFLQSAMAELGVRGRLDTDMIAHYLRTRDLEWYSRNPLLFVKVRSLSGSYFENQVLLLSRLRLSVSLLSMLHALSREDDGAGNRWASTSIVNNSQTLDIYHYLLCETPLRKRQKLGVQCVPMTAARLELAELSDLDVEFDPKEWSRRGKTVIELCAAIGKLETGALHHLVLGRKNAPARAFRKLYESLGYFRRSFRSGHSSAQQIISLATAFEMLLLDEFASGVKDRLVSRLRTILSGVAGTRSYQEALYDLYEERSSLVHAGTPTEKTKLALCQRAYVMAFLRMMRNVEKIPPKHARPMEFLIGA